VLVEAAPFDRPDRPPDAGRLALPASVNARGVSVTSAASSSPMALWTIGCRLAVSSDSMLISPRE
jgi:hypothetical protein